MKEDRRRTSIFVRPPPRRAGDKVLVVDDDTEANGPAAQLIQLVLETVFTQGVNYSFITWCCPAATKWTSPSSASWTLAPCHLKQAQTQ